MCLQLVEKLSPDIAFVLAPTQNSKSKWRDRRGNKQTNIDYRFVFVMGHMCLLFIPNKPNVMELAGCLHRVFKKMFFKETAR